jgi:alkylation response protein AidB-like acyl-CoA dehydrogenase
VDYRDSADEAAFRERLKEWLSERDRDFAPIGDEYWARQAEWHRALYSAGFFGLSWPREYGGHELPPVYDVILDEGSASPAPAATWRR